MICKKCGKEIPDDAKFCGFCGAVVENETEAQEATPVEETKTEETPVGEVKTEETPVEETKTEETPVEETTTEEPVEEEGKTEEPVETSVTETTEEPVQKDPESVEAKVEDGLKNSAAGKMLLGDDGKLDKDDFSRVMNDAKDGIKNVVSSVAWEDEFTLLLDILKNPFGDIALPIAPSVAIAVLAVIVNSCAFSSILNGIVVTALLYAGYFLVLFIEKTEPKLDLKKAFGKASQSIFVPVLAMLLSAILSALTGGLMSSFAGLGLGVLISLFFSVFSFVMYIVSMTKLVKKMNGYVLVVIITIILCFSLWFILNTMLASVFGSLAYLH